MVPRIYSQNIKIKQISILTLLIFGMLFSIQNVNAQCTINYVGGNALDLDVNGAGMASGADLISLVQANSTASAGCTVNVFTDAAGTNPFSAANMYDCATNLGTVITVFAKSEDIVTPQTPSGVISFNITITDGEAPTFTTLAGNLDRTVDCDNAADLAAAQSLEPVAIDNCTATSGLIISKTSGALVSTNGVCGTYTNTFTATDASSNVSMNFTQVITISDNVLPTFTAPADTIINCSESLLPSNTGDVKDESDNCSTTLNATFTDSPMSPPMGCLSYTITRTWTLSDACGNTAANQIQMITVQDTIAPTLTVPADITIGCSSAGTSTGTLTTPLGWADGETGIINLDNTGGNAASDVLINVSGGAEVGASISNVSVDLDINHSWVSDLKISVTSPSGTTVVLMDEECSTFSFGNVDNVTATFDDTGVAPVCSSSSTFNTHEDCNSDFLTSSGFSGLTLPEEVLSAFIGETMVEGDWTLTIEDGANGDGGCVENATINVDWTSGGTGTATATDNCSAVADISITFADAVTVGSCPQNSSIVRTWTATDECGRTTSKDQTITIEDTTPPMVTCPSDITINNAAGNCFNTVNLVVPGTITDNCGAVTFSSAMATDGKGNPIAIVNPTTSPTAVLPVGENMVTYNYEDECGNSGNCSYMVTVLDNEAPVITCVAPQTISFAACNSATILVPDVRGLAAVSDNCGGGNTITQNPPHTDLLSNHMTVADGNTLMIEVTVTDNNANNLSDACMIQIVLNQDDNLTPLIDGPVTPSILPTVNHDCGPAPFLIDAPTAIDACGNFICGIPIPSSAANLVSGFCNPSGAVTVSTGTADPNLPIPISNGAGDTYTSAINITDANIQVTDVNVSLNIEHTWVGDLQVTLTSPNGTTVSLVERPGLSGSAFGCFGNDIVATFDDQSANLNSQIDATCTQSFFGNNTNNSPDVSGDFQPFTSLSAFNGLFTAGAMNGDWILTVVDNVGGDGGQIVDWSLQVTTTGPASTPQYEILPGNHNITWLYDDLSGNTTQQFQEFNISNDSQLPTVNCQNITLQLDENGDATILPADFGSLLLSSSDNCGVDNTSLQLNGSSNAVTFDCSNIGTNNVIVSITDINGNTGSCTAIVTIEDNTPPVFDATTVPANMLTDCDDIPAVAVGIIANDNCGTVGMNFNETSTQIGNTGLCADYNYTITRTWTATDSDGNSSNHVQTITVIDNTAPAFTLPSTLSFSANQGSCQATVNLSVTSNDLSDNCAPYADLTITNDAPVGNGTTDASGVYPVGTTTVTFTAVDPCGKTSTHAVLVSVADDTPPIASCKNNVAATIPAGASQITIPYQLIDNGSFDNCAGLTYSVFPSSFDCSQADGVTAWPITLTVTEDVPGGQSSSCQTTIIIQDNTNPVPMCKDITVSLDANGNASITASDIDDGSFDACSGIASISLLTQSNFTVADVGANNASIVVTDNNGNSAICSSTVTVVPPETCFSVDDGINGNGFLAGTGINEVPVNTTNFINAQGFQFTLEIDETVATFIGINNVDPALTSGGLLTVIPNIAGDTLTVSWLNTSGTPLTLNTAQLFTITIDVVGVVGSTTPISFINLPTPPEFTSQYGTTIFTNPNFPPCTEDGLIEVDVTATLTVAGNIRTWGVTNIDTMINNTVMPPDTTITSTVIFPVQDVANVVISKTETHPSLNGGVPLSASNAATTDAAGDYLAAVSNQPGGVDLDLNASKGTPNWLNNGDVSSSDLFFIQQHIVANIPFISIFQYVASDVNEDGLVTTLDLVLIQDVIVNPEGSPSPSSVITTYAPWRFVPATDSLHLLPLPALPTAPIINEQISFNNYLTAVDDADWIAVKVGQVFGALNTSLLTVAETRSGEHLDLHVENQKVSSGELISIPVYAKDFADYIAWQFTLEFDVNTLEYEGLIPGAISNFRENKLGLNAVDQGIIGALWYGNALEVNEDEALFTLQFRAIENADALSGLLDISSKTVNAETSLINGAKGNVNLSFFEPATTVSSEFELHQNRPNPFNGKTIISFVLPEAGFGKLTIYDISGRVLKEVEGDFVKGYNEINIHSKDISTSGVLYYQLESAEYTATKKMIILD